MSHSVNLLGWRVFRRRQRVRFWLLLFIGLWLVTFLLVITGRQAQRQAQATQLVHLSGLQDLQQRLARKEKQLSEEQQQRLVWQKRERQRAETLRWRPLLENLAEQIPEQAWLTSLQWRGEALSLSGLALRFSAITTFDSALRKLAQPGAATPGPIRRDDRGRWQFSYQLKTGDANEAPH